MKQIPAWQAKDGAKFFNEAECIKHEKLREFENWHPENRIRSHGRDEPQTQHLHNWLLKNAEDIRGFLPPVEAKPELDIEVLKKWELHNSPVRAVAISAVEKWLAGELK